MKHLIINLIFLTVFQFISLFNFKLLVIALWVNNRRKWITAFQITFTFVSLSLSLFSVTRPVLLPTLRLYYALPTNTFSNFTIFIPWKLNHYSYFCHLSLFLSLVSILLPNYDITNCLTLIYSLISTHSTHSLSYLYNIREIVINIKSQSQKKNTTSTYWYLQFTITIITHPKKTQTPQAHILRFTNIILGFER